MRHIPLAAMLLAGLSLFASMACAQDESAPKTPTKPIGQFLTVTSPLNDQMVSELTNLATELQAQATRENREAILVLEIEPGTSGFGHVSDVVRFLTSSDVSRVRTIAWLPRPVDGTRAILALACHDIVMHPDATLGDIGRGEAVSAEDQSFVMSVIDRRRNSRLSRGVAQAMMNPAEALLRVSVETAPDTYEQQFLTPPELELLQIRNAVISKTEVIKEAGSPGVFHALDSEKAGFLVLRDGKNRSEVAAAFELPLESMREPLRKNEKVVPRVIAVDGAIIASRGVVQREVRNAVAEGCNVLILKIDSPGGDKDIAEHLALTLTEAGSTKITTIAWIPKGAWSGGALIAFDATRS